MCVYNIIYIHIYICMYIYMYVCADYNTYIHIIDRDIEITRSLTNMLGVVLTDRMPGTYIDATLSDSLCIH
jgi:hypothetical protein